MAKPSANRRRWLRYGTRTMLAVVAVLCVWLAYAIVPGRRQLQTVKKLRALNPPSTAHYDYEFAGAPQPRGPQWLRHWIGDTYFQHIASVELVLDGRDDVTPDNLANFPRLQRLVIEGRPLANESLRSLGQLRQLQYLAILTDDLTDQGLEQLSGVARLEHLSVKSSQVTAEGLGPLAALQKLRSLILESDCISPQGLRAVSQLGHLERLYVSSDSLTDEGLEALCGASALWELRIRGISNEGPPALTDAGFKHIARLRGSRRLYITSPAVTDDGLAHLAKLPALTELDLNHRQPKYTAEGVACLQSQLPALKVNGYIWKSEGGQTVLKSLTAAPKKQP